LYDPDRSLHFYSSPYTSSLRETLSKQMSAPCFPVEFESLRSRCTFTELDKDPFKYGKLTIWAYQQYHPNGACGYRIEYDGAVIVYATDREHDNSVLDTVFAEHVQDADILIHDAQYTLEEFEKFRGRGHSTWLEAVRVARAHNVKRLALFHHDPLHDDHAVSQMVTIAQQDFDGTIGAREGEVLTIV
jgi:ribonuclease BN (tRNA processing enzyme)